MTLTQNYKFAKFGPKTEICSDFYEIWHSHQIEHAYYENNIRHYIERSHDNRLRKWNYNTNYINNSSMNYNSFMLRMITGCKIRLTDRT